MSAYAAIPEELRERPQWVLWRFEERDGRTTKVPYRPREPFVRGSSTDASSWASFELALAVADQADGLGFVFTPDDPYCGIDLDAELPEADRAAIALALGSYTEVSPSGVGWHVIVRASLNGHARHRSGGLEVYDRARFFTMTGERVRGTPETIEERQAELEAVLAEFLPPPEPTGISRSPAQPVALDDRELLERMFRSRSGAKIARLWRGDTSGYPSRSEADLALATHLAFWTGRDAARIDRLFRLSRLYREKWGRQDYREATIEKAIAGTSEVYMGGKDSLSSLIGIQAGGKEIQVVSEGGVERSSTPVPPESHLPFQPLSVLVEKAPAEPSWSWRGYLALYVLALLAGRPKVGKSTVVLALVAAAVRGDAFLGLDTKASGVLLLTEERRDTLAEKARILGLMDAEVPVYVLTRHDAGDMPWAEVVREAMTFCNENEIDVLIVDTLDRWTGLRGDAENAAGAVNEAMEPLQFAAASGLAVLAISHQRKSSGEYGEAVRGSNAFTGAVDVVIELERPAKSLQLGSHARVLRSVSRFSSTPEELFFELGEDGFELISDVVDRRTDAERAQVLDALVRHEERVGLDDLYDLLEGELGKRILRGRLGELLAQGHVVRTGAGKKGDPFLWAAAENTEDGEADSTIVESSRAA